MISESTHYKILSTFNQNIFVSHHKLKTNHQIAEAGSYSIALGTSSTNIKQTTNFNLAKELVLKKQIQHLQQI